MHYVAVHVHGHTEARHPQRGAQFIHVHVAWLKNTVHMLDGVLNRGPREQVILAEHVHHPLGDGITQRQDALLDQRHDLAIHVLGLDVTQKVPFWHSIVGDVADVDRFNRLPFFIKDQIGEQRPSHHVAHRTPPSSGALKS